MKRLAGDAGFLVFHAAGLLLVMVAKGPQRPSEALEGDHDRLLGLRRLGGLERDREPAKGACVW